jgi:undecaprenyl-diphosphatase
MDFALLAKAAILGVVEGTTEFIPVSSTGHLIIAADWLGFSAPSAKTFEVFIQLGSILAIVWLYWDRLFHVVQDLPRSPTSRRFVLNLLVAFLPAAVVGFAARDAIKQYLFGPLTVAGALVVGGIAILVIERWGPVARVDEVDAIRPRTAMGVGLAQVLALFPGISRSGSTIMGGYALGLSRRAATEFSFFSAIPVMFAATLYDLFKSRSDLHLADIPLFAIGLLVAFLSALAIVGRFVAWVSRHDFVPFAWYRIGFGALLLAYYWPRV